MVRKSTFSLSTEGNNNNNHNSVVLDDMSILTESLLPMNSDNDIVIANQVDIDADVTNNNNNIPNIRRGKYHSTCHPRFIPEVARNMTWNDPFYLHDNEVIAVFDLNPNMSAGRLLSWPGFCYFLLGDFILVLWLHNDAGAFYDISFRLWIPLVFLWILTRCVFLPLERRRIRRGYKHLAIARRGIYMDESDGEAPHNDAHMRRTTIQLEDIQECYVTSFLGTYSHYDVVVKCKNGCFKYRRIHGYFETQKFVDIVNAMIVESRTTPNIVATW